MARHDPDLTKAFEANRAAISIASIPETALQNFMAMSPAERRHRHEVATQEAIRQDILAKAAERNGHDPQYARLCADNARKTAAALKAVGL